MTLNSSKTVEGLSETCVFYICGLETKPINTTEVEVEEGQLSQPTPQTTPRSGVRLKALNKSYRIEMRGVVGRGSAERRHT